MIRLISFCCLLLVHTLLFAQAQLPIRTRYVTATSGLNMRSEAKVGAPIVAKLPYGTSVEWMSIDHYDEIGGRQGAWVKVQAGKKTGFVFDAYLSLLPAPDVQFKNPEADCEHSVDFGYEYLLRQYLDQQVPSVSERVILSSTNESAEEEYHQLIMRQHKMGVVVFQDQWYESSSTRVRLFGMTPYQALAWVEALVGVCPNAPIMQREPIFVKDNSGHLLQIRDGLQDGYFYTIYSLGYLMVEIKMESGV